MDLITNLDDERINNPTPVDRIKLYRDSLRAALQQIAYKDDIIRILKISEAGKIREIERITFEADRIRGTNEDVAKLTERAEKAEAEATMWMEYAEHQEDCAICAESVDDCEKGSELRRDAGKGEE